MVKQKYIPPLVIQFTSLLALASVSIFLISILWQIIRPEAIPLADSSTLKLLASGKTVPTPPEETLAWFHGRQVTPPKLAELQPDQSVLGVNNLPIIDTLNKHIEVDLTKQKVYAYEGERKVFEFPVSTGKWAPTPTGEFTIWTKIRSTLMHGGDPKLGTYYYLPNVPYVMFFYNDEVPKMRGFSLHGTYWHDNFGHPMSHGCINMKSSDAKILYEWAFPQITDPKAWSTLASAQNPGTAIVIYGETPKE